MSPFIHHHDHAARRAFTLIEILVAVALMAVIMIGLLAMFYQAQRAVRFGTTQVDVLDTGRSTMQRLVSELEQACPSHKDDVTNLIAVPAPFSPFIQPRPQSNNHTNVIQDFFFLTRVNDEWIATGYFVEAPRGLVGSLYRWTGSTNVADADRYPQQALSQLYRDFQWAIKNFPNTKVHRVADRIMHLRLVPYLANGDTTNMFGGDGFVFLSSQMPAYLDLELGVLEPKAYEQFRAKTNNPNLDVARDYLREQVQRVHLFQHHIPVRTGL